MKALTVLFLVGVAAAIPTDDKAARHFTIHGAPVSADVRTGSINIDGLLSVESEGWRRLYDKPFILAVKQEGEPELTSFLIRRGLVGLPHSPETRALHNLLISGEEKAGVLLSAAKYLFAPELDMPVTKSILPADYTLGEAAQINSEFGYTLPVMLVAEKEHLKAAGLEKLSLVGDFYVTDNAIKVAADIPSPLSSIHSPGRLSSPSSPVKTTPTWTYAPVYIPTRSLEGWDSVYPGVSVYSNTYPPLSIDSVPLSIYPEHLIHSGLYTKYTPWRDIVV